jgi:hypothetical protein
MKFTKAGGTPVDFFLDLSAAVVVVEEECAAASSIDPTVDNAGLLAIDLCAASSSLERLWSNFTLFLATLSGGALAFFVPVVAALDVGVLLDFLALVPVVALELFDEAPAEVLAFDFFLSSPLSSIVITAFLRDFSVEFTAPEPLSFLFPDADVIEPEAFDLEGAFRLVVDADAPVGVDVFLSVFVLYTTKTK